MYKKPLISIVVPNYNHAKFLQKRLNSIINQSYKEFELILLDDNSTDNSIEILKSYKAHSNVKHLVLNNENSGSPFKQWQKGIELAQGDYVWIAESDDYSELNFLECAISTLIKGSDIFYCQSIDVNEKGHNIFDRVKYTKEFEPNIWNTDFTLKGLNFIREYLFYKNVIPNASAVVFKKALIDKTTFSANLLDMKMCGDWFFWIKISENAKIAFVNKPLNFFRNHNKISRNHNSILKKRNRLEEEMVIRKFIFSKYYLSSICVEKMVYKKWFNVHKLMDLFQANFYKIIMPKQSKTSFVLSFLRLKMSLLFFKN